jgi:hypothetical protein
MQCSSGMAPTSVARERDYVSAKDLPGWLKVGQEAAQNGPFLENRRLDNRLVK